MVAMRRSLTRRKRVGVFRESLLFYLFYLIFNGAYYRESLRRRSLQMGKTLTHSVGGYLPNTLTEMWEPSRDFAFLRLPTSGARCIVALSGQVTL